MKNFSIEVISKKPVIPEGMDQIFHRGIITFKDIEEGNISESFFMALNLWSLDDYKQQWKDGLYRIKSQNETCFVTNIGGDPKKPFVEMWVLYKKDGMIFVHNWWLILDRRARAQFKKTPFTTETCYQYITPRKTHTENGTKVSEWAFNYEE